MLPKERILEKLIKYILDKKGSLTLLNTPLYYQYYHLDFNEATIAYGYLDTPVYFYGDLTETSASDLFKYAENKSALKYLNTVTFDNAINMLTVLKDIESEQLEQQKGSHIPTSPEATARFYEKINLVKVVYFIKYVTLVKPIKKVIPKKRSSIKKAKNIDATAQVDKSSRTVTPIERIHYIYEIPDSMDENALKDLKGNLEREFNYTRHSWTTRGHYRTYKNGHKVWIKPTIRKRKAALLKSNTGTSLEPKAYTSNINNNS